MDQFETVQWMVVTFIIDEGPRYKIGNVSVTGNTKYTSEELLAELKLKGGEYFNQAKMTADMSALQDKYGGVGYVFADIKADPRFLEEPGTLDLVYKIKEGDRYRVGKIDVAIKGEYPHTKITTVLNRLSLKPGDIVDIREIRASERRLKASQLFENNPATGGSAQDRLQPAGKRKRRRGQAHASRPPAKIAAEGPRPEPGYKRRLLAGPTTEPRTARARSRANLVLDATAANPEAWRQLPVESPRTADPRQNYQPRASEAQNRPQQSPVQQTNQQSELIIRGQYTPDAGRSTPQVFQRPMWGGTRPTATTSASAPENASAPTQYPSTQPSQAYAYQGGPSYSQPQYTQPGYAQQTYPQQSYPQQGATSPAGQSYPPQPQTAQPSDNQYSQPYNNPYPAAQPETIPPGTVYGPGVPLAQPVPPAAQQPAPCPYNAAGAMPPPDRIAEPILTPGSPFNPLMLDPNDPTRLLPMNVTAEETQTGRFMFGVGVTSDAGVTGTIKIDEQNFDLFNFPRSWEDIKNFTAWRGQGEHLVIEAYPGTLVQRYAISFEEPYLFDSSVSMGLSGYYFSRAYTEWFETRIGGRVALGYQFSPDLSGSIAYRGAQVGISNIIDPTIPDLAEMQGNNALHGFQISKTPHGCPKRNVKSPRIANAPPTITESNNQATKRSHQKASLISGIVVTAGAAGADGALSAVTGVPHTGQ